ncbi:MAG: SprB repeat-containing protein [Saprospiraceae bacterium]
MLCCVESDSITISGITNPETCTEGGSIELSVNGGAGNYTYDWTDLAGTNDPANRSDLSPGDYRVQVTDENGCIQFADFSINAASNITLSGTATDMTCLENGSISLVVEGASGLVNYDWADLAGTDDPADRTNLDAGVYEVTVTDETGCAASTSFTIQPAPVVGVTGSVTNVTCNAGGSISLNLVGTTGLVTYDWADLAGTDDPSDRNNLSVGNYSVTITDENGCTASESFTVADDCGAVCDIEAGGIIADSSNICLNDTVVISATPDGNANTPVGSDGYFLLVDNNGVILAYDYNNQFTVSETGTYFIHFFAFENGGYDISSLTIGVTTIQDLISTFIPGGGTLCGDVDEVGAEIIVSSCCTAPVVAGVTTIEATCGFANGSISVAMPGNIEDYEFDWTPLAGVSISTFGNSRGSLPSGTYTIVISREDDPTCSTTIDVNLGNIDGPEAPSAFTSPATCGQANGAANFGVQPGMMFLWPDSVVATLRTDLAAGDYNVEIRDSSNFSCVTFATVVITEINNLTATANVLSEPDCAQSNGSVEIVVQGGSGSYNFSWNGDAQRDNLSEGTYTVTVSDANSGCETTVSFVLVAGGITQAIITIPDTVSTSCAGTYNGFINPDIQLPIGFANPSTVEIVDTDGNSYSNGDLPPGNFFLVVYDVNGCLAGQAPFTVVEPAALDLNITTRNITCDSVARIDVEVMGGVGPYTFDWLDINGVNNVQNRDSIPQGTYVVNVSDANGCFISSGPMNITNTCGCEAQFQVWSRFQMKFV